jgi:hypothetical protein
MKPIGFFLNSPQVLSNHAIISIYTNKDLNAVKVFIKFQLVLHGKAEIINDHQSSNFFWKFKFERLAGTGLGTPKGRISILCRLVTPAASPIFRQTEYNAVQINVSKSASRHRIYIFSPKWLEKKNSSKNYKSYLRSNDYEVWTASECCIPNILDIIVLENKKKKS